MTNADAEDIVTAGSDDVTVEKSFEPDDFPVPAIAFAIRSERDTAVSIRLVDTVPDDVSPENIGFHPKYGAEFWDVEDGRIVFQRDLAPGEEYTTVYGLRGGDADTASKFMSEPTLESIDPSLTDDNDDVDAALDAAKIDDLMPSDGETVELADSDEIERADERPEGAGPTEHETPTDAHESSDRSDQSDGGPAEDDLPDPIGGVEGSAPAGDGEPNDTPERDADETVSSAGDASLVSELAAEIGGGNVDDDDLMTLRDALGIDLASASVEARIEHLQSEVSDLEAYTDALEGFLDEEGDAQTLIAEAQDGHEEVADGLDELEAQLSDTRSEFDERLDAIDETLEERIDSEFEEIRSDMEALEKRLETERDARAEVESDVERLSTELADVAEMRDRLANALGGLAGGTPSGDADADDADADDDSADDANEANRDEDDGAADVTGSDDE